MIIPRHAAWGAVVLPAFMVSACTVKAVGDPNRPITIHHHITIDIKGLKNTASGIEDYVSGETPNGPKPSAPVKP